IAPGCMPICIARKATCRTRAIGTGRPASRPLPVRWRPNGMRSRGRCWNRIEPAGRSNVLLVRGEHGRQIVIAVDLLLSAQVAPGGDEDDGAERDDAGDEQAEQSRRTAVVIHGNLRYPDCRSIEVSKRASTGNGGQKLHRLNDRSQRGFRFPCAMQRERRGTTDHAGTKMNAPLTKSKL